MAFVLLKTIIQLSRGYCFKMEVICATTDSQNLIILCPVVWQNFFIAWLKQWVSVELEYLSLFLLITLSGTSGQWVPLRTSCTNSSSPFLQKEWHRAESYDIYRGGNDWEDCNAMLWRLRRFSLDTQTAVILLIRIYFWIRTIFYKILCVYFTYYFGHIEAPMHCSALERLIFLATTFRYSALYTCVANNHGYNQNQQCSQ